jgi:hypothetical protein
VEINEKRRYAFDESNHNRYLNPSLRRSIVASMQIALDGNGKVITAKEAVLRNETHGTCVECRGPARLHQAGPKGRPRAHFEHYGERKNCPLRAFPV